MNAVRVIISSVKNRAYTVGSLDSQSQYFEYVNIWDFTVEKIPRNKEAAAAKVVGSNPPPVPFLLFWYTTVLN